MPELLQDWVSVQGQRRPRATAVVSGDERLTYGALDRFSNQLARALKRAGVGRGDRICLLMPKGTLAIASILGIYKADAVYVPLDPSSPPARLARIIRSCGSRMILAAGCVSSLLDELIVRDEIDAGLIVAWMGIRPHAGKFTVGGPTLDDVLSQPDGTVDRENSAGDVAHVLFTSGSTGAPKGVMITHANVNAFVNWGVEYFGISPDERLSGHPPLHFDLSVFDIFGAFAAGAELHLVPSGLNVLPNKLSQWIYESGITQWFSVPSVLQYLERFDVVRQGAFPAMKRLLWCGDVLPTPTLIHFMRRLPHVSFTNLYGPTETTIASSHYTVPRCPEDASSPVPIGRACGGEELLILDESLNEVSPGRIGHLHIGGSGVSPGYWGDPERTAEAFVRRPGSTDPGARIYRTGDLARAGQDGCVYFLGRTDSQIKSRGYRIELGEIEAALNTLDAVHECAVVAIHSSGFENAEICCAYVPDEALEATPASVGEALRRLIPDYMIPTRWMRFEQLPKNVNGKIDRRRLKEAMLKNATVAN